MFRNFTQVVDDARKLESGNTFYKSTTFLANSIPAGIVLGASNPIVLTSRSNSYKSKLYSIALAVVSADLLWKY